MSEIEFVVTLPETSASKIAFENEVRQTHGVLIDIINSAQTYIILSAPYFQNLALANPNLNVAIMSALRRGVSLSLLSTEKSIKGANINQYRQYKITVYGLTAISPESITYSHSKFCLADGKQVYLGSANFTNAGLNWNLEMGVYSKGPLAKQVEVFWFYLIENDFIRKITN